MKNGIIILILFISFSLYAEDEAPSSIELIIPTIIIEFEGQSEQVMELIVPDYDEIVLPDFEIYLSDPGEIPIEEIEFDLPLPGFVEYNYSEGSSFFSEGFLGFGIKNHLLGNISLFRLGDRLRFSLSFAHDGMDGFGQNDAGTGYFYRKEAFEGDFRNGDESFMISGSGSFKENEDGLQQQVSSHTSIINRLSSVELGVAGNGSISWNGDLGLTIAEKTLTGVVPKLYDELVLSVNGGLGWKKDWFSISLMGDYVYDSQKEYNTTRTDENIIGSDLQLGFSFNAFDITATAGIFWLPGTYPEYPFSISLAGALKDILQYQTSGGYFFHNYLNYEIWNSYSFFGASAGVTEGWFWEGKLVVSSFQEIDFGIQWFYRNMSSYLSVDLGLDPTTGLFSVDDIPGSYLDLSSFIKWRMSSGWSLSFGWDGQMLTDIDLLYPAHSAYSDRWEGQMFTDIAIPHPVHSAWSEIRYTRDIFGIFLSGEYSLDPFITVPDISMGIHYTISNGVVLSMEGNNILGFFTEDQFSWEPYIKAGGTVALVTKISL